MKGTLHMTRLCFSSVPLQSWMQRIGLGLIVLGHLGYLLARRGDLPAATAGWCFGLGLMAIVLPPTIATGAIWRNISAPQALRLIPYVRVQILLSVLLTVLLLAAFVCLNVGLLKLEAPASRLLSMSLLTAFVIALATETALILLLFVMVGSSTYTWLMLFLLLIVPRLLGRFGILSGPIGRLGANRSIALLLVVTWIAFAAWYLRARRISTSTGRGSSVLGLGLWMDPDRGIEVSRRSAVMVYLLGLGSMTSLVRRAWLCLGAYALLIFVPLAFQHKGALRTDPNLGGLLVSGMVFALCSPAVFLASSIARRARTLWLPSGCSREQLFRICERLMWRCAAVLGIPALMLCIAAWIFLPHVATDWRYLAAAILASSTCALYLGLMNVRGWAVLDAVAALLVVVVGWGAAVFVPLFSSTPMTPVMITILIVDGIGAWGLRATAQRRWLRIDWFTFRPQRTPTQALRPAA